jgi:hypothetical protein
MEIRMKRAASALAVVALLCLFAGCKKQESDSDGIRTGINEHLSSLKTINLSAMDMNITNVSIQGNQAQAQVEFRPKTGGPPGAAMQVSYSLAKQNGLWVVQNTQPMGGSIQHPGPGENPHMNGNAPSSGALPNFRDLVPGGGNSNGSSNSLPPGHPPINGQDNSQQ